MKMIRSFILSVLMLISAQALTGLAYAGEVNINKADAPTLAMELQGIGDKKAQAIIDYRTTNGPFKSVDDLSKVKGISAKTIEKNRNNINL